MHVPDGFFDTATSVGAGVVTAGVVASSLKKATDELTDRLAPLCGLVAAFVFAAQMLTFPVAAGTSGHLMGGTMAAVLVGPWAGVLCVSIVVFVQALLFADGGLTAFGINALLIAIVPAFVGYAVYVAVRRVVPASHRGVVASASIAAFVSVPVAAMVFALMYAAGGAVEVPFRSLLAAMVGVHVFIGIGEAVITGTVVSTVAATRPDLMYGAPTPRSPAVVDAEHAPASTT